MSLPAGAAHQPYRRRWRSYLVDVWQLAGLSVLAVAEPIYALVRHHPEVLMARPGDPATAALVLVFTFNVCLPLLLIGFFTALRFAHLGLARVAFRAMMAILIAAIVLQLTLRFDLWWPWIALSLPLIAGLCGFALIYKKPLRLALTVLGASLILSPLLFLVSPRIATIFHYVGVDTSRAAPSDATTPVVMVVFDAMQLAALLDAGGHINPALYPNLSRFAATSVWYRNARTVSNNTAVSLPAILTGQMPPDDSKTPTALNYPGNLFTYLGTSHELHVEESLTRLCPEVLCDPGNVGLVDQGTGVVSDAVALYLHVQLPAAWSGFLPPVDKTWGGFWMIGEKRGHRPNRLTQYTNFLADIEPGEKTAVHFMHVMLPHLPYKFYPNGKKYAINGLGASSRHGKQSSETQISQLYQRYILQTMFVDRLIGELTGTLKRAGLFEEALIVLMADHGIHFGTTSDGRAINPVSADDVLRIPLLIKYPTQTRGRINDDLVYSIDVLPTVLDVLNVPVPESVYGLSLISAVTRKKQLPTQNYHGGWDSGVLSARVGGAFKPNDGVKRLSWAEGSFGVYHFGRYASLIGERVATVTPPLRNPSKLSLRQVPSLFSVKAGQDTLPGLVVGAHDKTQHTLHLALALNHRISATTRSYFDAAEEKWRFSFLLPPSSFENRIRSVQVFRIEETGTGAQNLVPVYQAAP